MFKIVDVKLERKNPEWFLKEKEAMWFLIEVGFSTPNGDESFGWLGKYYSAVAVPDVQAYEKHQEDPENLKWDFVETEKDGSGEIRFRKPSPYALGLCKFTQVLGGDHIYKEDGVWKYKQYVSSNYITEGALKQLLEMKEHQEKD